MSNEQVQELLPCPFCESEPRVVRLNAGYGYSYSCHCPNTECMATNSKFDSLEAATTAWNRRATTVPAAASVTPTELEALEGIALYCKATMTSEFVYNVRAESGRFLAAYDTLVAFLARLKEDNTNGR